MGGEKLSNIAWCIVIIIATILLKRPLAKLISGAIGRITNKITDRPHGKVFIVLVQTPLEALLQTILFYIAANQLEVLLNLFVVHRHQHMKNELMVSYGDVIDHIFLFCTILFSTLVLSRTIDFIYRVQLEKASERQNKQRQQLLPLFKEVAKLVLWTLGLFWVLGLVFHVNIPALVTGLGIGGVAIALAAKESVENFFAAFTILTDKPFLTGDTIKLGSLEGAVERIGFRSTRLRSADGSAFIVPNRKLVNETLENLSYRNNRRVRLMVNIRYGVAHETLEKIITELKLAIEGTAHVVQPVEIVLESFGENVFGLLVTYHLPAPLKEDARLVAIKQEVNMHIYEIVHKYTGGNVAGIQNVAIKDEEGEKDPPSASEEITGLF